MDDTKRLATALASEAWPYYEQPDEYFLRLARRAMEFCHASAPPTVETEVLSVVGAVILAGAEVVERAGELSIGQKRTLYQALILDEARGALTQGAKSAYVQAVISWLRADELEQPDVDTLRDWVHSHGYRKAVRDKDAAVVRWLGENIEPAQTPSEAASEPVAIPADKPASAGLANALRVSAAYTQISFEE